jgi:hypothetical protein
MVVCPTEKGIRWSSFFSAPAASRNRSGWNTVPSCRVKELLRSEHSSIFPAGTLEEWESNNHLSSARLPRQGTAQGGTKFHLPSSRPERMVIKWSSFFSASAASRNCQGRNKVPGCRPVGIEIKWLSFLIN